MSLLTQSHSDIGVTLNVYTLLGLEDAAVKMHGWGSWRVIDTIFHA